MRRNSLEGESILSFVRTGFLLAGSRCSSSNIFSLNLSDLVFALGLTETSITISPLVWHGPFVNPEVPNRRLGLIFSMEPSQSSPYCDQELLPDLEFVLALTTTREGNFELRHRSRFRCPLSWVQQ